MRTSILMAVSMLVAGAAHAHPGQHEHMSITQLIQHYAEPDHLAFLALTVIVGGLAYRIGRRAEAKALVAAAKKDRP